MVRLNVPTGIHLVFHVKLVHLAAIDLFPSEISNNTQPPPLLVNGEEEYEVKQILAI
jgi:hypothetical protein